MMIEGADPGTNLFDVKRLAALLGVKPGTIRTLRTRGKLPNPTSADINGGAVWAREIIEDFMGQEPATVLETTVNKDLPNVIDVFSGCGGLALGFQLAGFNVVAGYDNWKCAVETYRANLGHEAHLLDLSDLDATKSALEPHFMDSTAIPAIIGGPPCQDFSSAGPRKEGARADLTEKFADVVSHFMPPFFVMENVARAEHAAAYNRAIETLEAAGYSVAKKVLDASLCGAPQRRKRLFAVGSLDPNTVDATMVALETNLALKPMTLRDWFGNSLGIDHYYRHPRSYARRGVFSIDEPSPTIRGVNRPIPAGYPGHPGDTAPVSETRPLTTLERAQIQTFPEGFRFVGSRTEAEQMVGNAVPVRLAKYVASALAGSINLSSSRSIDVELPVRHRVAFQGQV